MLKLFENELIIQWFSVILNWQYQYITKACVEGYQYQLIFVFEFGDSRKGTRIYATMATKRVDLNGAGHCRLCYYQSGGKVMFSVVYVYVCSWCGRLSVQALPSSFPRHVQTCSLWSADCGKWPVGTQPKCLLVISFVNSFASHSPEYNWLKQ